MLAENGAKRGERNLLYGVRDSPDLHDGAFWVHNAIPNHRVDLYRDIVAGDALLLLNSRSHGAQVQLSLPLDEQPDDIKAGTCRPIEFAQAKDDGAFVLVCNTEASDQRGRDEYCDDCQNRV